MPDCSYDYAIVRVVPRVERGEFINAGVILLVPDARASSTRASSSIAARLLALAPDVDLDEVERALAVDSARSAAGDPRGGPIAAAAAARALPLAGRAAQHDHPDLAGAHRPVRRPRRRARQARRAPRSLIRAGGFR